MRILLVSQMYPGASEPDYGVFVRGLEEALAARGHTIERAVLTSRAGGKAKYARLAAPTLAAARRARGLPLSWLADRAQERRPPGAGVRGARRRNAHLRWRRPATPRARRAAASPPPRCRSIRADPGPDRRRSRRLPAEPGRALRSGSARGDGVRTLGRRNGGRRPARFRPAGSGRPCRPVRRDRTPRGTAGCLGAALSQPRRPRRRRAARRQ